MASISLRERIEGMFVGLMIGDALGAAYEFKSNQSYDGELKNYTVPTRAGTLKMPAGQPTDDTEMTLALLRTLIADDEYDHDHVLMAYLNWANGLTLEGKGPKRNVTGMGINTAKRFKGVKTIRGYNARLCKDADADKSQSNGTLMRAAPLALLSPDPTRVQSEVELDVRMSNPNNVSIEMTSFYVDCLKAALRGDDLPDYADIEEDIVFYTIHHAAGDELDDFFELTNQRSFGDKSKGWGLNPLFIAIRAYRNFTDFDEAMEAIIRTPEYGGAKSDSDTNASIAGALLGAHLGVEAVLRSDKMRRNWNKIMEWDGETGSTQPRQLDFIPGDQDHFNELMDAAVDLYESHNS